MFKCSSRMTSVVLLALSVILFTECKRSSKDEVSLGNEMRPASSSFFVSSAAHGFFTPFQSKNNAVLSTPTGSQKATASFKANSVYFGAKFSEVASWNINLKGLTSNAVKIISGTSDTLNLANTNWDGNSTGVPFFIKNELVVAELTVQGSSLVYRDTLKIGTPKPYDGLILKNGVAYTLIDDFEANPTESAPLASVSSDAFDKVEYRSATDKKVSGLQSFYMKGNDLNWNGYILAKTTTLLTNNFYIKTTDPNNLYFNLYIYGTGAPNTTVTLELFENEHPKEATFNLGSNDGWLFDVMVNWTGWKLVSIPYSAFKKAPSPLSAGNGNGVKEPQLISGVSITLNSYPTSGKVVDAYVDFVILSQNGPFIP